MWIISGNLRAYAGDAQHAADFFRLDNGKEQPNLSPCRISAITHILETEFMPIAMNKGLTLIVESHTDAVVLTDKERILQIGNNLLVKRHQVHG